VSLKHQKLLGRLKEVLRERNNKKFADLKLYEKTSIIKSRIWASKEKSISLFQHDKFKLA